MKRSILIGTILLLVSFLMTENFAQTVKVKREAMSSTKVNDYYLPGKPPAGTFQIYSGLRTVAKGAKVYVSADTTGTVSSFAWSFVETPAGSKVAFDKPTSKFTTFTPDSTGRYIVQVTGAGKTDKDTFFVSTYMGSFYVNNLPNGDVIPGCGVCHKPNYDNWSKTAHATIFKRGLTGQLEVEAGKGAYAAACVKCHTTGWDSKVDNGNFGYLAAKSGWDTTWYKGLELRNGDYWITTGDLSKWNQMNSMDSKMQNVGNIGCESCHGPGKDHLGNKNKISVSLDAGVCTQCHDALTKHRLGSYYNASAHAKWVDGEHTARTSCYPCHSGAAFVKWVNNNKTASTSIYSTNGLAEGDVALTCSACHDPHGNGNPNQIRTVTVDSLKNGFQVNNRGGKGQLCMNCHRSRYDVATKVTTKAPYYGFADHYGPHGSPQTDMYFGQNAYQNGEKWDNYTTHAFMDNGCVTCHMQERVNGASVHSDHEMSMTETDATTGQEKDLIEVCQKCHGSSITKFNDIKGQDYDGNGKVEGVQTEVTNMMNLLKAKLPINAATGDVTDAMADSLAIKNKPQVVKAIYNYLFVKSDKSMGIHNTKYTVALLKAALAAVSGTDVKVKNNEMPKSFELSQNFPNPFNPSTQIVFSVPSAARVKVNVYNIVGQLVATLTNGEFAPGNYTVTWNGRDMSGSMAASGIYLYRLEGTGVNGQNFNMTKKMVLTK
ncbi:MAG: ammonia-forming cytochrome c nitrite reductase subunit c552 [Ignavibacteriales bacterium]